MERDAPFEIPAHHQEKIASLLKPHMPGPYEVKITVFADMAGFLQQYDLVLQGSTTEQEK